MTSFSDKYKYIDKIGEGSFSEVLKVCDKNGQYFAAKKLLRSYNSMDEVMQVNEIRAMKTMDYHANVISIVDIIFEPAQHTLYLISELFDMNLYEYIKDRKRTLSEVRVKNFLYQMAKGLHHLHRNELFHRDLKPENILIRTDRPTTKHHPYRGEVVQLADLGSATYSTKRPPHSAYISTRWYRAPESLLTAGYYGPKIDIWALGCVFYELLTLTPLFPGENELDQLYKIHEVLGVPSESTYRRFRHATVPYSFPRRRATGLHSMVPALSQHGYAVLERTLHYLPDGRIGAAKLLEHAYFNDLRSHDQKVHRAFNSSPSLVNSSQTSCSSSGASIASAPYKGRRTSRTKNSGSSGAAPAKKPLMAAGSVEMGVVSRGEAPRIARSGRSSGDNQSQRSLSSGARKQPTEMQMRERMWGMNAGSAKMHIWQRLQKNVATAGSRIKSTERPSI